MNEPTLEEMMQYMMQSRREAFYLILIIHALFLAVALLVLWLIHRYLFPSVLIKVLMGVALFVYISDSIPRWRVYKYGHKNQNVWHGGIYVGYYECTKCKSLHGGIFGKGPTHKRITDTQCVHDWQAIHSNDFYQKFGLPCKDIIPDDEKSEDEKSTASDSGFLAGQKKYPRVRTAIEEKQSLLLSRLETLGLSPDNFHMLITACKAEQQLTVHVKRKGTEKYRPLVTYPVCASSGTLGPKRQQGDGQVPEGFYHIDRFNPSSSYYLSLGINYPNESDSKKSPASQLGGDIFIHGSCVTIGCLPVTDDLIKEIYLYAIYARNNGQKQIPVYIFPFEMTDTKFTHYTEHYKNDPALITFWENLRRGYLLFDKEKKQLSVKVSASGDYLF